MAWMMSAAFVNSLCSPERGGESLAGNCSDGEPSAPSSGSHTQLAYLPPDRMTAFSRLSRFGMMFKPLTADRGEELLTSYLAGFHARTSALRERAQGSTESDQACGNTWRGWLAKFDPDSCSWKTAQCSFIEDLNESCPTLPRSGMTRSGLLWERPMSERRTKETGSGLWPTPTALMMPCEGTVRIMRKKWQSGELSLEEASVVAGRDVRAAQGKVPAMWPTPNAQDHKTGMSNAPGRKQSSLPRTVAVLEGVTQTQCGGLNPMWVEALMGWPRNWTAIGVRNESEERACPQDMRALRSGDGSTTLGKREARQPFRGAPVLQHYMRWLSDYGKAGCGQEACATRNTAFAVQPLPIADGITAASQGSQPNEQRASEHRSFVPVVPCKGTHDGRHMGPWGGDWEDSLSRVESGVAARVERLKALGNGQVPLCAATAFRTLRTSLRTDTFFRGDSGAGKRQMKQSATNADDSQQLPLLQSNQALSEDS